MFEQQKQQLHERLQTTKKEDFPGYKPSMIPLHKYVVHKEGAVVYVKMEDDKQSMELHNKNFPTL